MKTRFFLKLFAIAIILFMQLELDAQVTIGSNIGPNAGTLLDIKEYTANDNTTTTKGMMLPRVNLTDMSNLYPMFLGDTDYENNTANKKDTEDAIHTGLTVYNTSVDFCADIYPGVRVWDGAKWEPVGKGRFPAEVDILIDNRNPAKPERYQIGKFGDGGWWMLENLRADRWPDGTTDGLVYGFPTGDMVYTDENGTSRRHGRQQYYPAMGDPAAVARHGHMYSFYAAIGVKQADLPEFMSELRGSQGICPDGWHVPSTPEYLLLRAEIEANPCKYAHSNIGENSSYNVQPMGETPNGRGRTPQQGGFNLSLIGSLGFISDTNGQTPNVDVLPILVGEWGQFWLSDRDEPIYDGQDYDKNTGMTYTPAILYDVYRMARWFPTEYIEQLSVRCVKDNSADLSKYPITRSASTATPDSRIKSEKIERPEMSEKGYLNLK